MILQQLSSMLPDDSPMLLCSNELHSHFFAVCLLPEDPGALSASTLYICYLSRALALAPRLSGLQLLLIEDRPFPSGRRFPECSVLLVRRHCSEDFLLSQCLRLLEQHCCRLDSQDVLLSAFLSGGSLEELASTASKLIRNPLLIVDLNFKILAHSQGPYGQGEEWLPSIERGYCSFEFIAEFEKRLASRPDGASHPFFMDAISSSSRLLIGRLVSHQKHLGYLMAAEVFSPLSRLDEALFTTISQMAASITFTQNELQKTLTEYSRDHIMLECLTGEFKTRNAFRERIRGTEFESESGYQVIVIDVSGYSGFDPRKEVLKSYMTSLFPLNWMLWFQGNVVTVIRTDRLARPALEILSEKASFFLEKRLRLGISDTFSDLFLLPQYSRQSLQALRLSKKLRPDNVFSVYNDYKFYDLLSSAKPAGSLESFFCAEFKRVLEYDRANGTEYTETICQYILSSRNLKRTASLLYIHKNTVTYRLSRAKELFCLDLDDAEFRFHFLASFRLKEMMEHLLLCEGSALC